MSQREAHTGAMRGALFGLLAAALFGASAPISKVLLGSLQPTLLAGLLYLGAALGLWLVRPFRAAAAEAPLQRRDLPALLGVVAAGGMVAPVLMLLGLQRLTGITGSLLLNLEAPFTTLLALLVFGEHIGRRGLWASVCILVGALVLKFEPGELSRDAIGMLLIGAACMCWALDNNLTQRLSLRDPFAVVRVKTTSAGVINTLIGLIWFQTELPAATVLASALGLGCLSYGVSVVLDAYALRLVGAAREAAYFATAPFLGAVISVVLLNESLSWIDIAGMAVMALGVALMLRDRHAHGHTHEALDHEHMHMHDEHHQHEHEPGQPHDEPHSHAHHHEPLEHDHPHVSDAHHRHRHE